MLKISKSQKVNKNPSAKGSILKDGWTEALMQSFFDRCPKKNNCEN